MFLISGSTKFVYPVKNYWLTLLKISVVIKFLLVLPPRSPPRISLIEDDEE